MLVLTANNALSSLSLTKPAVGEPNSIADADDAIVRLTAGLAAGDDAAFRELHSRYFDRLYCFLLAIARGNEDEVSEALQQTMLRVVRYARVFRSEEVFWGWLKALARSAARDAGRKQQRYAALLERFSIFRRPVEPERHSPEERTLSGLLAEVLEELPVDERQLVEGKYASGETVRELSIRTGLSEKAVEARLGRLRRQLRIRLIERLKEP